MAGDMHVSPCLCYFNSSSLAFFRPSQRRGEQENGAEDDWGTGFWPVGIRLNQPSFSAQYARTSCCPAGERPPRSSVSHNAWTRRGYCGNQTFLRVAAKDCLDKRRVTGWVTEELWHRCGDLAPWGAGAARRRKPPVPTVLTRALPRL